MLRAAKDATRRGAYAIGALDAWHRWRNRHSLTVAMFHRVLDPADPRWPDADPDYTVTASLFADCLAFFQRHYHVVSLPELVAARRDLRALPSWPLLITFDDGWADNSDYAQPLLQRAGLPSVVFVASDPVLSAEPLWWQEELFRARRLGVLRPAAVAADGRAMADASPARVPPDAVFSLVASLCELDEAARAAAVARTAAPRNDGRRDMVTAEQVRRFAAGGMAVGSHGASHAPLAGHGAAEQDLRRSRQSLEQLLAEAQPEGVLALSFPHGRYDAEALRAARSLGYVLLFTSDAVLNAIDRGAPCPDLLGRIPIEAAAITSADGALRPERLATWLFTRTRSRVAG